MGRIGPPADSLALLEPPLAPGQAFADRLPSRSAGPKGEICAPSRDQSIL